MARLPEYDEDRERRPRAPSTSGLAITSLIFGILGLIGCWFIGPLVALICGLIAQSGIRNSQGRVQGRGLALAGIILGCLGLVASLGGSYVLYQGFQHYRVSSDRMPTQSQLKQFVNAMHNYHGDFDRLPPYAITSKEGKPLLSWRVALLPYLEEDALYRQFNLEEPWDSPQNIKLLDQMPKVYRDRRFPETPENQTYFRVFVGPDTPFPPALPGQMPPSRTLGQMSVKDGTSNTLLIVEAGEAVPWTKPDELTFTKDGPLPALGGPSGDFFLYVMGDGMAYRARKNADPAKLRALIDWNDGVAVNPAELE